MDGVNRLFVLLLAFAGVLSSAFPQEKSRESARTIQLSQERDPECLQVRIDAGWATMEVSVKHLRRIAENGGQDAIRARRLIGFYESTPKKSGCVLLFNIWNVAAVAESGYLVGDLLEKGEAVVFVDAERPEQEIMVKEMAYAAYGMKVFNLRDGRGFYGYQLDKR